MVIQALGNLPPEAGKLRNTLQSQLPNIIDSFNQVLQQQYGISGMKVAQFTIIPTKKVGADQEAGVSCDQETCLTN